MKFFDSPLFFLSPGVDFLHRIGFEGFRFVFFFLFFFFFFSFFFFFFVSSPFAVVTFSLFSFFSTSLHQSLHLIFLPSNTVSILPPSRQVRFPCLGSTAALGPCGPLTRHNFLSPFSLFFPSPPSLIRHLGQCSWIRGVAPALIFFLLSLAPSSPVGSPLLFPFSCRLDP